LSFFFFYQTQQQAWPLSVTTNKKGHKYSRSFRLSDSFPKCRVDGIIVDCRHELDVNGVLPHKWNFLLRLSKAQLCWLLVPATSFECVLLQARRWSLYYKESITVIVPETEYGRFINNNCYLVLFFTTKRHLPKGTYGHQEIMDTCFDESTLQNSMEKVLPFGTSFVFASSDDVIDTKIVTAHRHRWTVMFT